MINVEAFKFTYIALNVLLMYLGYSILKNSREDLQ